MSGSIVFFFLLLLNLCFSVRVVFNLFYFILFCF